MQMMLSCKRTCFQDWKLYFSESIVIYIKVNYFQGEIFVDIFYVFKNYNPPHDN